MQAPSTLASADIDAVIHRHILDVRQLLESINAATVARMITAIDAVRRGGGTVYACGNGGSAATALHLCNDLLAGGALYPTPLRVSCLTANISTFSALANDTGYENVFVGQLRGLAANDLLIAISASGNSENCVRAVEHARAVGAATIGLVGFDGGRMLARCELVVHVARHDYLAVEDVHAVLCHAIARGLRQGAQA